MPSVVSFSNNTDLLILWKWCRISARFRNKITVTDANNSFLAHKWCPHDLSKKMASNFFGVLLWFAGVLSRPCTCFTVHNKRRHLLEMLSVEEYEIRIVQVTVFPLIYFSQQRVGSSHRKVVCICSCCITDRKNVGVKWCTVTASPGL